MNTSNEKNEKIKKYIDQTRKRHWDFFMMSFLAYEGEEKSVEHAHAMKEEAEEQVKKTRKEAENLQKEIWQNLWRKYCKIEKNWQVYQEHMTA